MDTMKDEILVNKPPILDGTIILVNKPPIMGEEPIFIGYRLAKKEIILKDFNDMPINWFSPLQLITNLKMESEDIT